MCEITSVAVIFGWFFDQDQLNEDEIQSIHDCCKEALKTFPTSDDNTTDTVIPLFDLCDKMDLDYAMCGSENDEDSAFAIGYAMLAAQGHNGSVASTNTLEVPPEYVKRVKELGEALKLDEPPQWHLVMFSNSDDIASTKK